MRVAFGKISITPDNPVGVPMAGYSRDHAANGKLDELYAHAVLIEDVVMGNINKKLLLISLDLLKVPMSVSNYIKEKIQEKVDFGLGAGNICITAIHTHSAPDLTGEFHWPGGLLQTIKGIMFGTGRGDKYVIWVTSKIVKLIKSMIPKLQPAKMAWTKKLIEREDILLNRRYPARHSKQKLGVIAFKNPDTNNLIGIIANFGVHPVTLSYKNDKLSADWVGVMRRKFEELSGLEESIAFFTAACGDLNPVTTSGTDFESLESSKNGHNLMFNQLGTYKSSKRIGHYLGQQAFELSQSIPIEEYYDHFEFKSYTRTFWVPVIDKQRYIYSLSNWIQNKAINFVKKFIILPITITVAGDDPNFPGEAIKHYPFSMKNGWKVNVYTIIQYIDITVSSQNGSKKLSIVALPGEPFEEMQESIFKHSSVGPENTFVFEIANDWIAYLMQEKDYLTRGGDEALESFPAVAGMFVEKELYRLWKEINAGMVNYS
jgi:hypothetical protein